MRTVCSSNYQHTVYVILYDGGASKYEMDWFSSDSLVPYKAVQNAYTQDMASFLLKYGSTTSYMFNWGYQYLGKPDKTMDLANSTIIVYTSGAFDTGNARQLLEHLVDLYPRKQYFHDGYIVRLDE
ncbi:hypothetical protein IWW47_001474 [Coemansia sp. RSA 2052]|nr:hypothetical protein GGF38_003978 [Coemansia sp. RSA 25]KAJ2506671.1 hypothetical protein IWW47_001474 [Coemansia sp. RSA 2052]